MAGYAVGQAFVIVWRESLEAIFIISILHACLKRSEPRALPAIWAGAAIGICFSLALALAMVSAQDALSGTTLVFFEAATLLASSILMTQMVFWMRKHARALRAKIESSLGGAASRSRAWSVP
jgi:high-affinity iron transporter